MKRARVIRLNLSKLRHIQRFLAESPHGRSLAGQARLDNSKVWLIYGYERRRKKALRQKAWSASLMAGGKRFGRPDASTSTTVTAAVNRISSARRTL